MKFDDIQKLRVSLFLKENKMNKRLSVRDIRRKKLSDKNQEPISSLVCYTAQMARLINDHVDIILVGDSMGMTI